MKGKKNQKNQKNLMNVDNLSKNELDKILKEFSNDNNDNNKKTPELEQKTPLSEALDKQKKDVLRAKLKNKINARSQMRNMQSKKEISDQVDEIKQMLKHPKMTEDILKLYADAIAYNPKQNIPKPIDILDNTDVYKSEYYKYILEFLSQIKEKKMGINEFNKLLDNPYSIYMSTCIGCPLNPFSSKTLNTNNSTDNSA